MTKKSKNPNEKTTHFDKKYPTTIGGRQFPSTDMEVQDEYGNVRLKKVFLDPNAGRVYYKINDNINDDRIKRVIPHHYLPEIIVTPHGNYQTTMDRNAPPLRLNTDLNNLSESSDKSNDKSNVRQTELEPSAEEQEILNKQALLKAAGYNVPQNGSWDLWQEEAWKKINTRHKQYDNTLAGMFQGLMDNLKGENTYQVNPLDQGEVKPYDYNNIDLGKTRRSQSNAVKQWEGTYGPIVAMATLGPALFTEPIATAVGIGAGAAGSKAVDYALEKTTGDDFGTLVAKNTPLSPGLAEYFNPGGIPYGGFVGKNMVNRGRYFLNNKEPVSYDLGRESLKALGKTIIEPFYKRPPTFYNGRRPDWYWEDVAKYGIDFAENRFQNEVLWGQRKIPESEVPITVYKQNSDDSWRLTPKGFKDKIDASMIPKDSEIFPDFLTAGEVGGEHSDFLKLGQGDGYSMMQYQDVQKLNPQWVFADKFKKKFNIDPNSTLGRIIDKAGGYPLDGLVGYKPFTIKQNYLHDGKTVLPMYNDPTQGYQQNFIFGPIDDLTKDIPFGSFHVDKKINK